MIIFGATRAQTLRGTNTCVERAEEKKQREKKDRVHIKEEEGSGKINSTGYLSQKEKVLSGPRVTRKEEIKRWERGEVREICAETSKRLL